MTALLILLLSFLAGTTPNIKDNSIGLVYLKALVSDSSADIEIVLPEPSANELPNGYKEKYFDSGEIIEIPFDGELQLFDSKGELITLHGKQTFKMQFWCENDGGIQFRPTLELKISLDDFNRLFDVEPELQKLIGFVITNPELSKLSRPASEHLSKDVRLTGDINGDGTPEAVVFVFYDDAENCDGEPQNNLVINLATSERSFWMRCCGP
tara:strand:+ start:280 stop:912 length:633 start_codon:yes stop_codon:yes gene_type:complete